MGKWGFEKNVRAQDWAVALPAVRKRKQEGKETELRINNKLISTKRLKKRMGRSDSNGRETDARDSNKSRSIRKAIANIAAVTPPPSDADAPTDVLVSLRKPQHKPEVHFLPFSLSCCSAKLWDIDHRTVSGARHSGSFHLYASLPSQAPRHLATLRLPKVIQDTFKTLTDDQSYQQHLFGSRSVLELFRNIVYKASNNLLSEEQFDVLVEWIDSSGYGGALAKFLERGGPSIEVFADKLFVCAIQALRINVARSLLESGISPSRKYRFHGSYFGEIWFP